MAARRKPKIEEFTAPNGDLYLEVKGARCRSDMEDTFAYLSPGTCAQMRLREHPEGVRVREVSVATNRRRQKLGTALYEHAAKLACERYNKPLVSDYTRSYLANQFWKKQVKKGRAMRVQQGATMYDETNMYYRLTCPAPKSLAGLRNRKSTKRSTKRRR